MVVLEPAQLPDLRGQSLLLLSGRRDPIVPLEHPERLAAQLRTAGADVQLQWLDTGHQLTEADFTHAARFLQAAA